MSQECMNLLLLLLLLFFNVSLIEKYEALKIKIKMLDFVNDINILIYNRFIELICKILSKIHNVYAKWVWTHDVIFTSEKYKFTHFTWKLKKFNMIISLCIENSMIKLKSDV